MTLLHDVLAHMRAGRWREAHDLVQDGSISATGARDALVQAAMGAGGVDQRNAEKTAEYGLTHGPRGDA